MSDPTRVPEYDENSRYTYADYMGWEGLERYQLINGKVFQIATPSVVYQALLMELSMQFADWLKGKPCRLLAAPLDMVVEIVSPLSTYCEFFLKFHDYLEAGVREYWVIDPEEKRILVHIYENGHFISSVHKGNGSLPVSILPGLNISLGNLWQAASA